MVRNLKMTKVALATIVVAATISAMIASPILSAFAQPAYTTVTGSSVTSQGNGNIVQFQVTTMGNIPHVADTYILSKGVFGYAWTDGSGNAVIAAIHPGIKDSTQNPNNWHPHTATLNAAGCVTSLASPEGGLAISGNVLTLTLQTSDATVTPGTFSAPALAFILSSSGCVVSPPPA